MNDSRSFVNANPTSSSTNGPTKYVVTHQGGLIARKQPDLQSETVGFLLPVDTVFVTSIAKSVDDTVFLFVDGVGWVVQRKGGLIVCSLVPNPTNPPQSAMPIAPMAPQRLTLPSTAPQPPIGQIPPPPFSQQYNTNNNNSTIRGEFYYLVVHPNGARFAMSPLSDAASTRSVAVHPMGTVVTGNYIPFLSSKQLIISLHLCFNI